MFPGVCPEPSRNFCHGKAAAELGFPLSQAELQKAVSEMDTDKHLGLHPFVHPEGFLPPLD